MRLRSPQFKQNFSRLARLPFQAALLVDDTIHGAVHAASDPVCRKSGLSKYGLSVTALAAGAAISVYNSAGISSFTMDGIEISRGQFIASAVIPYLCGLAMFTRENLDRNKITESTENIQTPMGSTFKSLRLPLLVSGVIAFSATYLGMRVYDLQEQFSKFSYSSSLAITTVAIACYLMSSENGMLKKLFNRLSDSAQCSLELVRVRTRN